MKTYKIHVYGIADPIQITENQKERLVKYCNDSIQRERMKNLNGFNFKPSAVASIEPNYDKLESYLIEQTHSEATKGLHEANKEKLPTDTLFLSWDLEVIPGMTRHDLEKAHIPYVVATCHYEIEASGERSYYLKLEQIKSAVYMKPDEDGYPSYVAKSYHYGKKLVHGEYELSGKKHTGWHYE